MDGTILSLPWNAAGAAHNIILQSLIEIGLIGTIIAGFFVWLVIKQALSAPLIAVFAISLVGFPEQNPATALMIVCIFSLACQQSSQSRP